MTTTMIHEIRSALMAYGVGRARVTYRFGMGYVTVGGLHYGIYDFHKHTFVA